MSELKAEPIVATDRIHSDPVRYLQPPTGERSFFDPRKIDPEGSGKLMLDRTDISRIIQDNKSTQADRTSRLARQALEAFAVHYDLETVAAPTARQLKLDYYSAATELHFDKRTDTEAAFSVLNDNLTPFYQRTPIFVADAIQRMHDFSPDAHLAAKVVRLWTAEYLGVEIPTHLENMLEKSRSDNRPAQVIGYTAIHYQ